MKTNIIKYMLFLIMIINISVVSAETGSVIVKSESTFSTNPTTSAVGGSTIFTQLRFDTANWDTIEEYYISFTNPNDVFLLQANSTFFTCDAPNVCNGVVSYNRLGNILLWDFATGADISSSPISMTYEVNIFDSYNIGQGTQVYATESVGGNIPVCLANSFSASRCAGGISGGVPVRTISSTNSSVGFSTTLNYIITYPLDGKFSGSIDKEGAINNKVTFVNVIEEIYYAESTFTSTDFTLPLLPYGNQLWINVSLASGIHKLQLINSTVGAGYEDEEEVISGTISTNKASYNLTETLLYNVTLENAECGTVDCRVSIFRYVDNERKILYNDYTITNGVTNSSFYIFDSIVPSSTYYIALQIYNATGWHSISYQMFAIKSIVPKIDFNRKLYNLGETISINVQYYETGYIKLFDSENNLKLNESILSSGLITLSYYLNQNDLSGEWTAKLYNESSELTYDITYVNFDVIVDPTIVPTVTVTTGALIDIGDTFSQVVFGNIDSDNSGAYSDDEITNVGNKIFSTLLLICFILLLAGAYYAVTNKKRR